MQKESEVEAYLVMRVEELCGITAKMTIRGRRGWPDRLVILPGSVMVLVELKKPKGGRLSAGQIELHKQLARCGIPVILLNNTRAIDQFLDQHYLGVAERTTGNS